MGYFRSSKLIILLFFVFIFIFTPVVTAAYQIGAFYVQHRVYEDGRKFNRYYFEILDDLGNFIPGGDVVDKATVKIYVNTNDEVTISAVAWDPDYDFLAGWFDDFAGKGIGPGFYRNPGCIPGILYPGGHRRFFCRHQYAKKRI